MPQGGFEVKTRNGRANNKNGRLVGSGHFLTTRRREESAAWSGRVDLNHRPPEPHAGFGGFSIPAALLNYLNFLNLGWRSNIEKRREKSNTCHKSVTLFGACFFPLTCTVCNVILLMCT